MFKFEIQPTSYNKKSFFFSFTLFFILFCFLSSFSVVAQNKRENDSTAKQIKEAKRLKDSLAIQNEKTQNLLENSAKKEEEDRVSKFINNQNIHKQNKFFNLIKLEVKNAKTLLNKGFDYKDINQEIQQLEVWNEFAVRGTVGKKYRVLTDRNLSSVAFLLDELLIRANSRTIIINKESSELSRSIEKIDSLVIQKNLYYVPTDSVSREIYHQQSEKMNSDIDLISLRLKNAMDSIQSLVILGDQLKYKIETDIIKNNNLRRLELKQTFDKKVPVFENFSNSGMINKEFFYYSFKTNSLVLYFYTINNLNMLLIMLIIIIGFAFYFKLQKRRVLALQRKDNLANEINMLNSPISTAVLVVSNLYQFILPMPPVIFSILIWTVSIIALTVILWNSIQKNVWVLWIAIFILNLLAFVDIFNLFHFIGESYLILIINCFAISIGIYVFTIKNVKYKSYYFWYFSIATLLQIASFYFILNGNYNLSKFLMSKGVYTIIVTFLLFNTLLTLKEIRLVSNYLKEFEEDNLKKSINTPVIHQFSFGFFLVIFLGWFLLMARNTYTFQNFIKPIKSSFAEPRNLGNITFSFENILVFILVILLASFISKVISFLASETKIGTKNQIKSIGSWLFIVKITIITIGVLVAFASAGIPLDKITLIISALGVGIGFGMQGLVNNLIGGLIIAFEKPVNLDDVIEVGTQSGKMKSIGIRSSVVTTYDGADVIIPNGDLLSQNLINWTLGSNRRRAAITLGVAYGTNLELTEKLLSLILENNKRVMKSPKPVIWFTKFGDSSIDLVIKYWILHFDLEFEIRSELIMTIDKTFKENGIVIPFSQQDVHIITKPTEKK